jgi:uncharacterized membrane protein YccC
MLARTPRKEPSMDDLIAPVLMSLFGAAAIAAMFSLLIWAAIQDGRHDRRYRHLR